MVKDFKYIIKRIIIGVGIALLLSFFRGNLFIMAHAQTDTFNASTSCVFSSSSGANSEVCKTPPNTVVGGDEVNIWWTQSTLLQPSTTYFLEFRVKIIGLDTNVSQFNQYGARATKIFTGNNGTASSEAYPDRNENFSFYHTDRNTAYLVWTFELDSLSTFNTIRISFFTGTQVGSIGGVMYTRGGIESATMRITSDNSSSGGSSTFDDTGIINNANDNANNIINNNNQNTQNIIDSNNANSQAIQDSIDNALGDDCINAQTVHPTFTGVALARSGTNFQYYTSDSNSGGVYDVSRYVGKDITVSFSGLGNHTPRTNYCVGSVQAISSSTRCLVGSVITSASTSGSYTFTVPENGKYLYVVGYNNYVDQNWVDNVSIYLPKVCTSKIDKTTDAINDMNDTLKDESGVSNSDLNDLFDDIDDGESNSPVSDLLTMPLTLLNAYITGMSGTCSAFNLGNLYGTNLVFPCINMSDYLGSSLWGLVDSLFCIYMIYNIGMLCISIYEGITSLDDSMQLLYTPQHANSRMAQRGGTYNG